MEEELVKRNWEHRFDIFALSKYTTYWKTIGEYDLVISRHIKETKWTATLVDKENEITLNYDADIKWVLDLVELLSVNEN